MGYRRRLESHLVLLAELVGFAGGKEANDQAEQTKDGAEDLDHKDLDESSRGISMSAAVFLDLGEATYSDGSAASASAAPLPLIPTVIPHTRLQPPTVMPAQNRANPV